MPLISSSARYFDEVARQGSIRRAAERLNASPSAVNRQILNLEAEYGARLFERLPRGVRLTAAGEMLLYKVRAWQRELDQVQRHLRELKGLRRGHASVGLMECLAADFAPRIFAHIQERHPGITLAASVGGTEQIIRDIVAGQIDIGLAFNVPDNPNVKRAWSIAVPVGAVMAADHPLAAGSAAKLSDFAQHPMVLPDRSLAMHALIDSALAQAGIEPAPMMVSNSIELIKGMARFGKLIALLSRIDVYREVAGGTLVFRELTDPYLKPEILSIAASPKRLQSPIVGTVVEAFRIALEQMMGTLEKPMLARNLLETSSDAET